MPVGSNKIVNKFSKSKTKTKAKLNNKRLSICCSNELLNKINKYRKKVPISVFIRDCLVKYIKEKFENKQKQ